MVGSVFVMLQAQPLSSFLKAESGEQSRQFQPPVVVGMKIIQDFQKQKAVYRALKFPIYFKGPHLMKI